MIKDVITHKSSGRGMNLEVSLCELFGTILCAVFGIMTTRHDRARIVPARATRRRTAKDFAGRALNESQKTARSYQRGSRNSRPPDAFAFCLRYSAKVASARFSSETDFCSRAVLMASQNEVSICVS